MHSANSKSFPILVVVSFILISDLPVDGRCPDADNERIQQCVHPVAEYAKILNQQDNNTNSNGRNQFGNALQLPKLGGQVFRELCRLIRSFEMCVDAYRDQCPKHITINLIEASYGYLCNEGFETFMSSAECLMDLDQQPAVKHCHDETLKDIEGANIESALRMDSKLTRMCGALNYFSACVRPHIWQRCGVDAWHVIFRVLKDTTKTLMPTCQFNGESEKSDAERRVEEQNRFARTRRPQSRKSSIPLRTTSTPDDFPVLPTSSMFTSAETESARSVEAEIDGDSLGGKLRPPQPQHRNDQPISFEIHEESEPPDAAANYERFRIWSHSSRSQSSCSLLTSFLIIGFLSRLGGFL